LAAQFNSGSSSVRRRRKTSTRRRSLIPCVVVEKNTTRRREDGVVVVEKNIYKVDEDLIKIFAIHFTAITYIKIPIAYLIISCKN